MKIGCAFRRTAVKHVTHLHGNQQVHLYEQLRRTRVYGRNQAKNTSTKTSTKRLHDLLRQKQSLSGLTDWHWGLFSQILDMQFLEYLHGYNESNLRPRPPIHLKSFLERTRSIGSLEMFVGVFIEGDLS